ncbi:hypothetical protein [Brochothrix thermosphacta]|uniref:hypothetical protein n=1 Tax=Brochothrix thermosphacta TaxID=2756 RepID=UPI00083FD1D2|nr:hypothetical protein [Brochothrix thermosphacta]ODJ62660.1 hypothetical protein BFR35_10430 [Brochothrix thermosphacta]
MKNNSRKRIYEREAILVMREKIRKGLLYLQKSEIDKRKYNAYMEEKSEFVYLPKDELHSKYVHAKIAVEHSKRVLVLTYIIFFFAIVILIKSAKDGMMHYSLSMFENFSKEQEVLNIISVYSNSTIFILVSIIISVILFSMLADMKKVQRKLLIIELELNRKLI